ncbi:TPA: MCE family protein [Candidatus Galligastranaerophilus intestinigallinarum]|nr:MCE family protein [Candidatus Galligastranaerophilus intestinigallinarum]
MKKEVIVEILILICIIGAIVFGLSMFNHYKFEKPNSYNILFKDIDSIVKGSPVRFMGMNVGHVVKLKRKDKYIICKIRITKENVKLPDMTRAKVAFNGLGGSKSIELLPPTTNDPEIKGIIAAESMRINDLAGMVKDLVDVAVIINDFVQAIDPVMVSVTLKEFSNPEIINRVDSDMEKIIKLQNGVNKKTDDTINKEESAVELIDNFNNLIEENSK